MTITEEQFKQRMCLMLGVDDIPKKDDMPEDSNSKSKEALTTTTDIPESSDDVDFAGNVRVMRIDDSFSVTPVFEKHAASVPKAPEQTTSTNTDEVRFGYDSGDDADDNSRPDLTYMGEYLPSCLEANIRVDTSPDSKPPSHPPSRTGFVPNNCPPIVGALAEPGESFCPIIAVSKYPYKFIMDHGLSERVAAIFFNDAKFWRYSWKIYYSWPPFSVSAKPLLLVPVRQVEILIDTINEEFDGTVPSLSAVSRDFGLTFKFNGTHPSLRPRFLGFSFTQDQFKNLERNVPGHSYRTPDETKPSAPPADADLSFFTRQLESATVLGRARKPNKVARQEQRVQKQQDWRTDLKQAETFLGLRPQAPAFPEEDATWEQIQTHEKLTEDAKNPPAVLDNVLPPYYMPPTVFISIDIECFEHDKSKVTEVGISTLDNRDIHGSPGSLAENWREHIRHRHLRIKEHCHLNNTDFVQGCAGEFRFGESEFVSLADAPKVISDCFQPPYSQPNMTAAEYIHKDIPKIVLVGHDFSNDIRYLGRLGYSIKSLTNLHITHPIIDTQILYKAHTGNQDPDRLADVLKDMDITAWSLHNAGNDAAYTLQAMLAIAVKSAGEKHSKQVRRRFEELTKTRVANAVNFAAERAIVDSEGWSSQNEDEDAGTRLREHL